jgi:hypothetical protein
MSAEESSPDASDAVTSIFDLSLAFSYPRFKEPRQTDNDRADAFKHRAAKYFLAASIDLDRPSEQNAPKNLKKLAQLEYRIEGDLDDKGDFYKPGAKVHVKKN